MPEPVLEPLNPEQRAAVTHGDGPLLVLAGAGSGKTRVIAHRIAYLLLHKHVSPRSILAVTFTNKAAGEMRERVMALLKKDALPFLWIGTFHATCARILRADVESLATTHTRDFTILDADESQGLIKSILKDRGVSDRNFPPRSVASAISRAKTAGQDAMAFEAKAVGHFANTVAVLYKDYERRLLSSNAMDFDDLLGLTLRLFEEKKEVRARYADQFQYVLVDEYQDTNRIQYELLRHLSSRWGNVFAVGDEDQSIYRWRGADIQNILDFQRDFPKATVVKLERNYRSRKAILDTANALVAHNERRLGKNLWTEREGGPSARLFRAPTDREEASFVADAMRTLNAQYPWSKMAVLYRTNAQSRTFEEACLNRQIPYQVIGGLKFYERREVKDVLAYLRLGLNPLDRIALLRAINVPPRGIGKATVEQLETLARERDTSLYGALKIAVEEELVPLRPRRSLQSFLDVVEEVRRSISTTVPAALAERVISRVEYIPYLEGLSEAGPDPETRIENIRELISAMREFEAKEQGDLRLFLERQALASDQDDLKNGAYDSVKLMTLHAAKGLEFPVVFLAGLEQDLMPHALSVDSKEGLEEERRLCYVGMTRAMDALYLTFAAQRYVFGVVQDRLASPFLGEIPPSLLEEVGGVSRGPMALQEAAALLEKVQAAPAPKSYRPGARVRHAKYGFGIVLGTEGSGDGLKVTVAFNKAGKKKLLAEMAKLEMI
jgi:DNA helicase-2/ATP-dependent DNA helicase PcrA